MKETWSIWKLPYSKHYYLTHPWKWFVDVKQNITDAYRRCKYGWTYVDAWNWNTWFLQVTPAMLRYIAEHGNGYPGRPPFDGENGFERWHDWLKEVADLLESGDEDWQDAHNEYHEEYMEHLMDNWEPPVKDENGFLHHKFKEQTEIQEKYFIRSQELAEQGDQNVRRALGMMAEHFWSLWD